MEMVYILLPLSLLLALGGFVAYLWAVRSGQFEDLDSPALRMLFDQDEKVGKRKVSRQSTVHKGGNGGGNLPPSSDR